MARNVTHEEHGPYLIDDEEFTEQGGTAAVCQCGLSDDQPYCDGSHNDTTDEDEGVVYEYDDDGERAVVDE